MRRALPTIFLAGLVAGTLDGLAACIQDTLNSGKNPFRVFYHIASGVFGVERAYGSGPVMAVLGIRSCRGSPRSSSGSCTGP